MVTPTLEQTNIYPFTLPRPQVFALLLALLAE